MFGFVSEKKVV